MISCVVQAVKVVKSEEFVEEHYEPALPIPELRSAQKEGASELALNKSWSHKGSVGTIESIIGDRQSGRGGEIGVVWIKVKRTLKQLNLKAV
jgi:hypothetical protein